MAAHLCLYAFVAVLFGLSKGLNTTEDNGYFWLINDLHYDPTYWTSQSSCYEPVANPGKYGDYECDPPWELMESSVKALESLGNDAEFIVWLGDITPHFNNKSELTSDLQLEIIGNITTLLLNTFPDTPIFPLIGNHDYFPKNQLPGGSSPYYDSLGDIWAPCFDDAEVTAKFKEGGYYSKQISEKLKALVPNTNLYSVNNDVTNDDPDPGMQFEWMKEELNDAREKNEKVYVFLHVPPGMLEAGRRVNWLRENFNEIFLDILQEYSDVIMGSVAGHSHKDTFKIVYKDGEHSPGSAMFIAPSITPSFTPRIARHGMDIRDPHNPGVRKFVFEKDSYELVDYEQFYLDLPKANKDGAGWESLYNFTELYGVEDASPESVQKVLDNIKASDIEFRRYYDMYLVNIEEELIPECDCECKGQHLCAIEYMDFVDYDHCLADREMECDQEPSKKNNIGLVVETHTMWVFCACIASLYHFFKM